MQTTDCLVWELNGKKISYLKMNGSLAEMHGKDYLFFSRPFEFIIRHLPWQIGATIIRREAMIKAGLFDTTFKISEDGDLMARLALERAVWNNQ